MPSKQMTLTALFVASVSVFGLPLYVHADEPESEKLLELLDSQGRDVNTQQLLIKKVREARNKLIQIVQGRNSRGQKISSGAEDVRTEWTHDGNVESIMYSQVARVAGSECAIQVEVNLEQKTYIGKSSIDCPTTKISLRRFALGVVKTPSELAGKDSVAKGQSAFSEMTCAEDPQLCGDRFEGPESRAQ